jgi:hypothetical protein
MKEELHHKNQTAANSLGQSRGDRLTNIGITLAVFHRAPSSPRASTVPNFATVVYPKRNN